jgi:hypothetical protein
MHPDALIIQDPALLQQVNLFEVAEPDASESELQPRQACSGSFGGRTGTLVPSQPGWLTASLEPDQQLVRG